MILKGRKKIFSEFSSEDLLGADGVFKIQQTINNALITHQMNATDIDYLIKYRNGVQPVLDKEKNVREEINHKVVINHAQMFTRNIVSYFLGTPIQYIQAGGKKKDQIDKLNQWVAYEDKQSVDAEIGEYQSICGTAYRIIFTDGKYADEVPFEDKALNPLNTFVVYENTIAEKPLMGVTFRPILDEMNMMVGMRVFAYTDHGVYEFISNSGDGTLELNGLYKSFAPYNVGGVPIIEYPNNIWRIGDWELQLGLMDAINDLQSGRLDDVDQIVQSLLVFVNVDIDEETYKDMTKAGIVCLKNNSNANSSVQSLQNSLDQAGMNMYAGELEKMLYALVGVPDRNNRAGGGGDTGQAVELRDGWADLEIVARAKEKSFKQSEKQALKIILTILANKNKKFKLMLSDVDIKFSRNKNNNLLVKTQGLMNLLGTKIISPEDCLAIVDLVSDPNEYIERGMAFWGDEFAGKTKEKEVVEPADGVVGQDDGQKEQEMKENSKNIQNNE